MKNEYSTETTPPIMTDWYLGHQLSRVGEAAFCQSHDISGGPKRLVKPTPPPPSQKSLLP